MNEKCNIHTRYFTVPQQNYLNMDDIKKFETISIFVLNKCIENLANEMNT